MALWQYEEAILDLLDAGLSASEVAARGYTKAQIGRVANTIGTAARHENGDRQRAERMRKGSQALLRAIRHEARRAGGRT